MKEATIILRPKMYFVTKDELQKVGFHSMTMVNVIGRGKAPVKYDNDNSDAPKHRLVAKKMINMYINDEDEQLLIDTVLRVNGFNQSGDGKIFIAQVEKVIRIRTGETGPDALV